MTKEETATDNTFIPDLPVVKRGRGRPKKEKESDMLPLTLGLMLQQARHAKHMKISSIAKKLCIKEIYLEALENGSYHVFPALAYGTGFLRTYASFLELDPQELIDRFHKETGGIKEEPLDMPRSHDAKIMPSRKTIIRSLIALLLLYFVWNLFQALSQKPFPEVSAPVVSEPEVTLQSDTETPLTVDDIKNVTTPVKEVKKEEQLVKKEPAPVQRTPVTYGLKQVARVSFVATGTTLIEIRDTEADSILLKKTMERGDKYNPDEDPEGLVLKTTNAGGLDVYVDGKKLKTLGKKGQTKAGVRMDAESLLKD